MSILGLRGRKEIASRGGAEKILAVYADTMIDRRCFSVMEGETMDIMVSDRLAGQLHEAALADTAKTAAPEFMNAWYADVYRIKNRKFYIFTEAMTMFSVFAYGRGVTSGAAFVPFFHDAVRRAILELLPMMSVTSPENPPLRFLAPERNAVSEAQAIHIARAKSYAANRVKSSECNMQMISTSDGRIPVLLFMAEIVKLFEDNQSILNINQLN